MWEILLYYRAQCCSFATSYDGKPNLSLVFSPLPHLNNRTVEGFPQEMISTTLHQGTLWSFMLSDSIRTSGMCVSQDECYCLPERSPYWLTSAQHPSRWRGSCFNLVVLPGHSSSTFLLMWSNFSLLPPPPTAPALVLAVLIYRPLRFNAPFLGEVSVLVSDLRSPMLLIPGDFNLHMDVTSDTRQRIHCITCFTPAVSARSSPCTERLRFWFH